MVEALYLFLQRIGYHHPLHPPLTHLPMGLIMACFIFALLAMLLSQPALLRSAYHCCLLAVAALVPTAVAGVLDWLHRFGGSMETLIVIKLVLAPVFLLVLLLALWQARAGASAGRMLVLYGLATLCAVGLGFSGGELVYGG
ncbi:MAG: hypothetical protein HQQ73_07815 [Desulfobulbaceae bacterium]|nr:hypothetical protein [Desulfobulbaceae bacterium]